MSGPNQQAALSALAGVRKVLAHLEGPRGSEDLAADIFDLWAGVEASLRALIGGSSLSGQQLIRVARQSEAISIDQGHNLLEFLAARDRVNRTSYKPTQADGDAARQGFRALESALSGSPPAAQQPRAPQNETTSAPAAASPYAPPAQRTAPPAYVPPPSERPTTIEQPPPDFDRGPVKKPLPKIGAAYTAPPAAPPRGQVATSEEALRVAEGRKFPLAAKIGLPLLALLLIGGGYWAFTQRGGPEADLNAGVESLRAGQRERARGEFSKVARDNPTLATPHVFLARMARESGDMNGARAQLDTALRLDPKSAIALREMGLVLLFSRQYDLARKFFVRAVNANSADPAAKGYLGCSLMRLNRPDEARKWLDRAGSGAWSVCTQNQATPPPL